VQGLVSAAGDQLEGNSRRGAGAEIRSGFEAVSQARVILRQTPQPLGIWYAGGGHGGRKFGQAIGKLVNDDVVYGRGVRMRSSRSRGPKLIVQGTQDTVLDEDDVGDVLRYGPALRSGLEIPLGFRKAPDGAEDSVSGFFQVQASPVHLGLGQSVLEGWL